MVTRKTTTKKASAKAPAPKKPAATRKSATTTPRAKTRSTLVKLDYMKAVLGDEKHCCRGMRRRHCRIHICTRSAIASTQLFDRLRFNAGCCRQPSGPADSGRS